MTCTNASEIYPIVVKTVGIEFGVKVRILFQIVDAQSFQSETDGCINFANCAGFGVLAIFLDLKIVPIST